MAHIKIRPIGIVHSPYKECKEIPIQGRFKDDIEAWVEIKDEFVKGLKDLDKFSHCILIYYFHKSDKEKIEEIPFLEDVKHGIFAIRSPHRPNHIGFSIVKIKRISQNKIYFSEVDIIDKTPILDIKPYVKYFDYREDVISGWLDKHFKNGNTPDRTILK